MPSEPRRWRISHSKDHMVINGPPTGGSVYVEEVPWLDPREYGRVSPRECIRAARDALNRAYGYSDPPWPLIAEAVDWQRRALEQMTPNDVGANHAE